MDYGEATWPAPGLGSSWDSSVYEKTNDGVTDSVVVYTNVEASDGSGYAVYYETDRTGPA